MFKDNWMDKHSMSLFPALKFKTRFFQLFSVWEAAGKSDHMTPLQKQSLQKKLVMFPDPDKGIYYLK